MAKGISVKFEHLTFKVKCGLLKKTDKTVLDQISGEFRENELSVIMGPSGSGKSSLLNILTGFTTKDFSGSIEINGSARNFRLIRHHSAYIMQDQNLYSQLTVRESMNFAVRFKTGARLSTREQQDKLDSVLKQLGLYDTLDMTVMNLSGGQQKRLSIAIELVDDPAVLFLDEPTTGLDSSSSTQCIKLLKRLARQGKTVIATVHSPSALLFESFDHIYVLAEGTCIYQGLSRNVVPYLTNELGLVCPESYNPADYLLEISTNDYGPQNHRLREKIQNGLNENFRLQTNKELKSDQSSLKVGRSNYSAPFMLQLQLLLSRNFILMKRDKSFMALRLIVHFFMALLVGCLFFNIGNLASQILDNYKYAYVTTHFITYSSYFSLMVRFPLDLPVLRREHFNRWYSSLSYYLALSLADAPVLIACTVMYNVISYVMTGQPLDQHRIGIVISMSILLSFTAQVFGLFAGSMYGLTKTLIIAALLMIIHVMFAGVLVLQKDSLSIMKWIFDLNFLKHANDGVVIAIFGYNREKLHCDEIYCHFQNPETFLKLIDAPADCSDSYYPLVIILTVIHCATFYNMNNRLKRV